MDSKPGQVYNWKIEIDGITMGGIMTIQGIEGEVKVIESSTGSDPIIHKRPGKVTYSNITIERKVPESIDDPLYQWWKLVSEGKTERKSGSIIYLDREGNEVLRYKFTGAWPCRWKAPELNSYAIERIELAVEKVERSK